VIGAPSRPALRQPLQAVAEAPGNY
jgi:hypothetical protein